MVVALVVGLAFAAVDVVGEVTCPTPADVGRLLADMVPPAPGTPAERHRAHLSRRPQGIHVELLRANGERIAERDLAVDENCADLAGATAVVIAAWEADLDPRLTARVALPAPEPRATPTPVVIAATPPAPPLSPPTTFEVGLGLIASLSGGQVAPGARIGGRIAPGGWHLGLGVAVSGLTARPEPVGARSDAARWSRIAFAAGPQIRFDVGRTKIDAHAQALAARLAVEGAGLTMNASDSTAQFGTGVGVQLGRSSGNATPWIAADLLFWPGHDRLEITGLAARGELPRLELQLALGLSLGRLP